jgi:hypothetical protein
MEDRAQREERGGGVRRGRNRRETEELKSKMMKMKKK